MSGDSEPWLRAGDDSDSDSDAGRVDSDAFFLLMAFFTSFLKNPSFLGFSFIPITDPIAPPMTAPIRKPLIFLSIFIGKTLCSARRNALLLFRNFNCFRFSYYVYFYFTGVGQVVFYFCRDFFREFLRLTILHYCSIDYCSYFSSR